MHKFAAQRKNTKGNKRESTPTASESLVASKLAYKKAAQAVDVAKLAITKKESRPLTGNLLSNEARMPWENIVQAQMTKCPWEDIYGVTHDKSPTKTWVSFVECVTFHLQQVFSHDAGKTLKYYITLHIEETQSDPSCQFLV
jgi:hypothetical protein